MEYVHENIVLPLPHKLADGLSTGAMLFASMWAGRDGVLEVVLALNWAASFVWHVFPSRTTLLLDLYGIQAVTHARLSRIDPWLANASRAAFVVLMNGKDIRSILLQNVILVGLAHAAVFVHQWRQDGAWPIDYACSVVAGAVFYALSDVFLRKKKYAYKTLSTCAFHASLGVTQSIETRFYRIGHDAPTELIILLATIAVMAVKLISFSSSPANKSHVYARTIDRDCR